MRTSFNLVSVWGIPIRIHLSLLVLLGIVGVLAWNIGGSEMAVFNIALLVIVFTSIALHELAHSLVAIRKGCDVREITLMFVGGAAQMEELPRKPIDEILIALAGPAFSLLLAAVAWFGGSLLDWPLLPSAWGGRPLNLVQLTGQINLTLALFNLLPAFPMDGGRVMRALISRKVGFLPATFIASRLGRVAAIIMGIIGFKTELWALIIIAIFLFRAAGREFDYVLRQELTDGMRKLHSWARGSSDSNVKDVDGPVKISPPPYGRK
jgi:Zn-dependent protease